MAKLSKLFVLITLTFLLLIATINCALITVKAQGNATVAVYDSVGGTVDPAGTNTYADGIVVTLTATPKDTTFVFSYWIVSTDFGINTVEVNPVTLTVAGGVTYALQAVFQPIEPVPGKPLPTDLTKAAIVIVLVSGGGTTSPAPGRYALANTESLILTAIPNSGWQFSHWTISGSTTGSSGAPVNLTPSDNPYKVNHGYGYAYNYQAVFIPVGTTEPTPFVIPEGTFGGISIETWIIIALVALVLAMMGFTAYTIRGKK
jgi:hypothetical protein